MMEVEVFAPWYGVCHTQEGITPFNRWSEEVQAFASVLALSVDWLLTGGKSCPDMATRNERARLVGWSKEK